MISKKEALGEGRMVFSKCSIIEDLREERQSCENY